uniref:Coiled-coil domain-containing protein 12 n=1 Tax=Meloidogyne incognita TaxID=6306 RepID=A0A914MFM8_MELIC
MVTTTNSEEAIIEEERILTELEKNAISRRQHLLEMRKRFVGRNQGNGDVDSEQNCGVERFPIQFRSYKPVNVQQQSSPSEPPREEINLLKEKIEGQLEAGKDAKIGESLDINTLAPRKVDWDLRRGIKEKLDKLDKRTNKAIIQLIRKRVKEEAGNEELIAYAVQEMGND